MKKQLVIIAFAALISLLVITPNLAEASITGTPLWTNPERRNYSDDYYGTISVAYERGATAVLLVTVRNNRGTLAYFNVNLEMDWATENATSTETIIEAGDSHTFQLQITIPNNVSNLYTHSYTVYSMYKYASGDNWSNDQSISYNGFAVYSPEQSTANTLLIELDAYPSYSYTPLLSSAKARELLTNARLERNLGDQSYSRGNFTAARDHYQNALTNTQNAYASDTDYLSNFETTVVGLVSAGQTFLSFQGWAFLVAAIGFLLMGIGVIIYLIRKSSSAATK